jgi:integrase
MRVYLPESTRAIPPGAKVSQEKKTVTYKGRDGEIVKAVLTAGGKMRVSQGTWHIGFRDHLDRQQDIAAFEDEGDSNVLASHIKNLVLWHGKPLPPDLQAYCDQLRPRIAEALQACGLLEEKESPLPGPLARPLVELVTEYGGTLAARGRNKLHVEKTIGMIHEVVTTCEFSVWSDIDRDKVDAFLRDLREGPRHIGYRRSNAYLTAIKSFCNWIVNDRGWTGESPLRTLKGLDAREDRRHPRRVLSMPEFKRLLETTVKGPERFGYTGRERAVLYALIFETGLRAGEVKRLRVADFDLQGHRVLVRGVKATKNKVNRWQALSPGLCGELAVVLANKVPNVTPFPLPKRNAACVLRPDLADAGISYVAPDGTYFDFHSLRGECASGLIATGTDIKTAQGIMRHATAAMTLDIYAKILDQNSSGRAIAGLRDLYANESKQAVAVKTGTDDAREIYGELYAQDKQHKTIPGHTGQTKADTEQNTALPIQKRAALGRQAP